MQPHDLSPAEAAALIGVHEETLKRWARDGKVAAFRTPGGWWRFRQSDLETFVDSGGAVLVDDEPTEDGAA